MKLQTRRGHPIAIASCEVCDFLYGDGEVATTRHTARAHVLETGHEMLLVVERGDRIRPATEPPAQEHDHART